MRGCEKKTAVPVINKHAVVSWFRLFDQSPMGLICVCGLPGVVCGASVTGAFVPKTSVAAPAS